MKRSALFACKALVFFMASVLVCWGSPAGADQITLKVTNWFPVGHKQDLLLKEWGQELEKRSGNRIAVRYYGGGTLVPAAQTYDAVVKGIVDVGNHVMGYTMGRFPFSQALDLPIGFPPGAGPTMIANDFYNKFKPKEFDDVKILWFHAMPYGLVHTRSKPVKKLEDMAGLKLRCYGSNARFVSNLGAAPVAMPMPEVYDALAKGVVDGLLSSYEALQGFRTGEHIKYTTENLQTAYSAAFVVAMNKKTFDSLPQDLKKVVEDLGRSYISKYGEMWAEIDEKGKAWLLQRGVAIIPLDDAEQARWFEKGSRPVVDDYVKQMQEKGLPGKEAVDFLAQAFRSFGRR